MSIGPKPKWIESQKIFDPRQRSTLRGLKKCPSCGTINGQRSLVCKNLECDLRKKMLLNVRPYDPIQLVNYSGVLLYSLRSKEREVNSRNFVQISEMTLSLQASNAAIISKNAVCFVESCKYETSESIGVTCKHIKACKNESGKGGASGAFPKAEVYMISREVLYNMNISLEQKHHIWKMYKADEFTIPAVQRLNESLFVVKSEETKFFPAGRLHVSTVMGCSASKAKNHHACSCKKMKIIVGDDNSVVMQDEICSHIIMLLAAILSHPNGKTTYDSFVKSLKSFWMPQSLNIPVLDVITNDHFLSDDLNLCNNNEDHNSDDGIFLFNDTFMTNDVLPDLSDAILEFSGSNNNNNNTNNNNINNNLSSPDTASPLPNCFSNESNTMPMSLMPLGDPNLISSLDLNEDSGMDLQSITTFIESIQQSSPPASPHMELTDCNIELMDQFQLTDQLDICSNDLSYPLLASTQVNNGISIFPPQVETTTITYPQSNSLLKTNLLPNPTTVQVVEAPPIELPTIEVVKKCPVKVSEIVESVNTRKFPPLPAKRPLIVNDSTGSVETSQSENCLINGFEPALAYSVWLEYVIESINESVTITNQNRVFHNFHIHEEIFAHFSKSFSTGSKLRIPNSSTTVKHGAKKGLTKYTWYFTTASTVKRIFQTKNICIALDRYFELDSEGTFVPYVPNQMEATQKGRRIYPKLMLYTASINFAAGDANCKTGLKIEWTPKIFPTSNFGFLTVEFSLRILEPQTHLPLKTV